jgi:hypothetical protein
MQFLSAKIMIVAGGALIFGMVFYLRAWIAFAWFATNSFLFVVAAGNIEMAVVGAGLCLLLAGDDQTLRGLILRVLAYGVLLIKPQGTIFIVAIYILLRRDWKGAIAAMLIYGLPFLRLYPDWLNAVIYHPPLAQTVSAHTLMRKYGPLLAGLVAGLILLARRWNWWALGGALAGILAPYGMVGLPILLTLTGAKRLSTAIIVVIYSGCLAAITWTAPPQGIQYFDWVSPMMAIYQLSLLGLALALVCLEMGEDPFQTIDVRSWLTAGWRWARKRKVQ